MSRIAKSSFGGAPTDNLEAVDVYGQVTTETRNNFFSQVSDFGDNVVNALGRQNKALKDISDIALGKPIPDPRAAQRRLQGVLEGSRASINQLSDDLQTSMLEGLGVSSAEASQIQAQVGNTVQKIRQGSVDDANAVADMLGDLSGEQGVVKVLDLEAQASVFNGILQEVNRWGVPDAVDQVFESIEDDDVKREVVSRNSQQLGDLGNIDVLERYVDQGSVVINALLENNPQLPRTTLARYQFLPDTTPGDYPTRLAQLVKVLDALDPNWFTVQRNGEAVTDLTTIQKASDDARLLFLTDDQYRPAVLTAEHYPAEDVRTLLKDSYPYLPV